MWPRWRALGVGDGNVWGDQPTAYGFEPTLTPGFAFEYSSTAATIGVVNTAWDGNPDRASMVNGWMAATCRATPWPKRSDRPDAAASRDCKSSR